MAIWIGLDRFIVFLSKKLEPESQEFAETSPPPEKNIQMGGGGWTYPPPTSTLKKSKKKKEGRMDIAINGCFY